MKRDVVSVCGGFLFVFAWFILAGARQRYVGRRRPVPLLMTFTNSWGGDDTQMVTVIYLHSLSARYSNPPY